MLAYLGTMANEIFTALQREFQKNYRTSNIATLQVDDIVNVFEEKQTCLKWLLGLINELIYSCNYAARAVKIYFGTNKWTPY